ncbi:PTPRJ phosphatase, partial [Sterrhoptilus dennistouni]|nr:PTPRJ phosphatase [Sterrhoptilus dennistouni]
FIGSSMIYNLEAESIDVTSVTLKWLLNSSASGNYTYRIEFVNGTNGTPVQILGLNDTKAKITDLIPGTKYIFTVFAVADDTEAEEERASIDVYTRPSQVVTFEAESIGVTSVTLKWVVTDSASDSYMYRIEFVNDTFVENRTFSDIRGEITELIPGTMYNFTVFAIAADNETEGEGKSTQLYTRPSRVATLEAESIGETSVTLKWVMNDNASNTYTYRIEVVNGTNGTPVKNLTSTKTEAKITDLIPGTEY